MRIVTLTLHPALDRIIEVKKLEPGKTFDSTLVRFVPSGKGVNTARGLKALLPKIEVVAAVWLGEAEISTFAKFLNPLGVTLAACPRNCATRQTITILEAGGRETHAKEAMTLAAPREEKQLLAFVRELLQPDDFFVFCGSAPKNTSAATIESIFRIARDNGVSKIVADSYGQSLEIAAAAGLDGIKGNASEIAPWLGLASPLNIRSSAHRATLGRAIKNPDAPQAVMITLGSRGVALADGGRFLHVPPPEVTPLEEQRFASATGCGDAATAGWVSAIARGLGSEDRVKWASACGTAKFASADPGELDAKFARLLFSRCKVL